MRASFLVASLASAFAIAAPQAAQAQSYCCKVRPDVCKGICGARCCGGAKLSAGGCGGADMSKVPTANLQAELKAVGRGNAEFSKLVRAELASRTAAAKVKAK